MDTNEQRNNASKYDPEKVTYFAETDSRNKKVSFGIKTKDRSKHVYVIGKTGMGKSTLLENMAVQDIRNGEGMAFVDPHGKSADLLLNYIPENRINDVIYFAPFDTDNPISFNVMEDVGVDKRHLVVSGLMSAFKKIWVDAWSARMEYILNNILLALLEYPDSTLIGVNRMLSDKEYRNKVVQNVTDPSVKTFWTDEFAKYGERYMQEAGAAIQNKIGQFISNPLVRNIIGQSKSTFDIREIMDTKKIMIINLSKGRVGEMNANLLGSMLVTKIYLGAMSRADVSERELERLPQFYLYVDEFQSFANESFADILSEARKYKLSLTIAHQYIEQMSDEVRAAVFGNVGTMITFRVGAFDAEVLEKEFAPVFLAEDLVNLGFTQIYLKLMIDGVSSSPFSAVTLPCIEAPKESYKDMAVAESRKKYSRPRSIVEDEIKSWHKSGENKDNNQPKNRNTSDSGNQQKKFETHISHNTYNAHNTHNTHSTQSTHNTHSTQSTHNTHSTESTHPIHQKERSSISEPPKKNTDHINHKKPNEENMSELRRALSSITIAHPNVHKNITPEKKPIQANQQNETPRESLPKDNHDVKFPLPHQENRTVTHRNEIPESELKKILAIDEN